MEKVTKILTYILAAIGLASIAKHIHTMRSKEGCCICGCKTKVEDEKPAETTSQKTKEEEKTTGSRYGSNPAKY